MKHPFLAVYAFGFSKFGYSMSNGRGRKQVKSLWIRSLLLLSLFFNISHASIIAAEDHCTHETVSEYVNEMTQSQECHDLCDFHHLFHMAAIITSPVVYIGHPDYTEHPVATLLSYHPPFKETENKPPIA